MATYKFISKTLRVSNLGTLKKGTYYRKRFALDRCLFWRAPISDKAVASHGRPVSPSPGESLCLSRGTAPRRGLAGPRGAHGGSRFLLINVDTRRYRVGGALAFLRVLVYFGVFGVECHVVTG